MVCGDVTSSGTVSAPQLFASNTLIVTNTSDFSDDLFLTKNWAGWSKLQVSNNSAAPDSGPELRLLGEDGDCRGRRGRAAAAVRLRGGQAVQAPGHERNLRLGFASDDFAGTKWKNLTGTTRWSDGTEMVTLDYSHLTSVLWGVRKGFQARLDEVEAWQAQQRPKNK